MDKLTILACTPQEYDEVLQQIAYFRKHNLLIKYTVEEGPMGWFFLVDVLEGWFEHQEA